MNNFHFNGKHYLHIGETALGTRPVPSYANLIMGRLKETILKIEQNGLKPTLYLDDMFIICDQEEEKVEKVHPINK